MTIRHRVSQTGEVEEALPRSEAKYRAIFEKMQDIFFRTDRQGFIVEISPSVKRYGYAREELIGAPAAGVYEDPEKRITLTQLLENGEVTDREVRLKARDGRVVDFSVSFHTMWDPDGAPAGTEGCLRDISDRKRVEEELQKHRDRLEEMVGERTAELGQTNERLRREAEERRQAEEALRRSEEHFSKAFHATPLAVVMAAVSDGRIVDANEGFLQLMGYGREEVIGRSTLELGMWVDSMDRERMVQEVLKRGSVPNWELRMRTKSGETRVWLTAFVTIELDGVPCVLGMSRDITEHRQAEEALKDSEERFRAIVENAPFGYYRVGNDGLWQYVNPVWERMHGYSAKDVIGKPFEITQTGEDVEAARQNVQRALTGETLTGEFSRATRQGTTEHHTFSIQPVRQGNEIVAIEGFINDITERRRVEEALRDSETRYRELFDGINSGVAVYEACSDGEDFVFRDFNQAGERIDSIQKEVVLGRRVTEVFPGIREFGLLDVFRRVWRTGTPEHHPVSIYRDNRIAGWRENYVYKLPSGEIVALYEEITERKRAEEALRESEERFRQVLEVSSDLICRVDIATGASEYVSPAVLPLTGFTPEEVIAMGIRGFRQRIHPDDWPRYMQRIDGFLSRGADVGAARRYEYRWQCKDGQYRWFSDSLALVRGEDGQPLALVVNARDTTERHQGEKALRESEERFRQVLDVSSDMVYKLDLESDTFDYISPSVLEMTGFTREEVIAMGFRGIRHLIHPEDWPQYRRGINEFTQIASRDGAPRRYEYRWQCKDGQCRWFDEGRALVRDTEGRPVAVVGAIRDVTERRVREEALRESEERFRSLSAAAPIGIFLTDAQGNAIYANEHLQSLGGAPFGENTGHAWTKFIHADDRDAVLTEASRAAAEQREFSQEFRMLTSAGGERWVHATARAMLSPEGIVTGHVGTIEDITERKQAEERDRQLHAEHVRANELRTMVRLLEQMAATLGHELRNPLGVISNSAYFLANQAGIDDPKVEKHAEIIGREVASAKRVIDDILEFAHVPEILPSPASLNAIVYQALARSQVPANIRVARTLAVDLPPLVCDEERLERGFLDVITNAVQAMPHGGRLSVKTRRAADSVAAVFADTGEGIAPQNLAKIFDPMFTTKLRGIGLGLTVVRRTVEQHGGRVEVRSVLGHGTTVTIMLPVGRAVLPLEQR